MKTIILYATKYGMTRRCSEELSKQIGVDAVCYDLKAKELPGLKEYERVIIGGSVYMGKVKKEVQRYCLTHKAELLTKKLGIFICGMQDEAVLTQELESSYASEIFKHATAKEFFGGGFDFQVMNPMDKLITKKVSGITETTERLFRVNMDRFVSDLK